jgi:hypothetical protein
MADLVGDLGDAGKVQGIVDHVLDRLFAAGAAMLVAAGQALAAQLSKKAP